MVKEGKRWRLVELPGPHLCGSWAMMNGGLAVCTQVAWYEVRREDLPVGVDPYSLLQERMRFAAHSPDDTVAMMTSRLISSLGLYV